MIIEDLLRKIAEKAQEGVKLGEDDNLYDYCGSNVDDAYYLGVRDGMVMFAEELLAPPKPRLVRT